MNGPLLFGLLVALGVIIGFAAVWRFGRREDPVEARLREYGVSAQPAVSASDEASGADHRPAWPGVTRLLAGFGLGPRLATALAQADLPLTAAEFTVILLGAGFLGFFIGTVRAGPLLGLAGGALCAFLPIFYVRLRQSRHRRAFTEQLPEVVTLLVGGLRAGHGLAQALETIVEQVGPPASTEFGRAMRTVELGLPVQRALNEMAERVSIDDLDLVVTAINVQYEMGGNLAQTLDTIGETVRDRIRMLREIRVLTAQQRMTGYVLAALPVGLAILLFILNPEYMGSLFEPGWIRLLPAAAALMQITGFLVIRRIVDIEV